MQYLLMGSVLLLAACQSRTAVSPSAGTSSPTTATASLYETRWVLRQLNGRAVTLPPDARESYLLLRAAGRAEGFGGCNRFGGNAAQTAPDQLRFGALFSTKMACVDNTLSTNETSFLAALAQTRRYHISSDTLRLLGEGGARPLARLEAVYLH